LVDQLPRSLELAQLRMQRSEKRKDGSSPEHADRHVPQMSPKTRDAFRHRRGAPVNCTGNLLKARRDWKSRPPVVLESPFLGVLPSGVITAEASEDVSHQQPRPGKRPLVLEGLECRDGLLRDCKELLRCTLRLGHEASVGRFDARSQLDTAVAVRGGTFRRLAEPCITCVRLSDAQVSNSELAHQLVPRFLIRREQT